MEAAHDAARHLITAVEAFPLVFAQTEILQRGERLLELGSIFFFFFAEQEEGKKW